MLELSERIGQYLQLNDLEKIFYHMKTNHLTPQEVSYDDHFFQTEIRPEPGLTREETIRRYRALVSATVDNRYISSELYIPKGRTMYIRKFPRYMQVHEHYHKDVLEIDMVLRGTFSQKIGNTRLQMKAGTVCLISPNVRHTARIGSEDSVVLTGMVYQSVIRELLSSVDAEENILHTYLLRILYGSTYSPYLLCDMEFDPDLAGLMMEVEQIQHYSGAHMNNYVEAGNRLFLLRLLVKHEHELQMGTEVAKSDSDILNIMDYIETNYAEITLQSLARSYNYSPNYLSALIRSQYGRTFHEILTDVKMKKAAELLRQTDYSMTRISEQTGFSDKSYFLKRFKKYYGMTPSEYRARQA